IEAERGALPVDSKIAGILGVQDSLPVTQPRDNRAAGLLAEDISVGKAPLAARFLDDLRQPARNRAEKPMTGVDNFVRGVLPALGRGTAGRRSGTGGRR